MNPIFARCAEHQDWLWGGCVLGLVAFTLLVWMTPGE